MNTVPTTERIEFTQEFTDLLTAPSSLKEVRLQMLRTFLLIIEEKAVEMMDERGNLTYTPEMVIGTFAREYDDVRMALYENNPFKFYREMADLIGKGVSDYVLCQEKTLCFQKAS